MCVCTFACVYAHTGADVQGTQKRMLDNLELEIQEAMSVKQMLGTELQSSTRAVHIEQPLQLHFGVKVLLI